MCGCALCLPLAACTRRINILGFCQSVDMLNEALEETVVARGGEVLEQERRLKSGIHEQVRALVPGWPQVMTCHWDSLAVGCCSTGSVGSCGGRGCSYNYVSCCSTAMQDLLCVCRGHRHCCCFWVV